MVALPRIILKRWPGAGVEVLVNNAGLGRNNAALWDGSTASWVEMISTNVLGVCMCTREAIQVCGIPRPAQCGSTASLASAWQRRFISPGVRLLISLYARACGGEVSAMCNTMCNVDSQDMERRGQFGHIINISSMSGHRVPDGAGGGAFYSATKFALRALTEGLRQEVRVLLYGLLT